MITKNSYFDGKVQSLGYVMTDGIKATVGVLLPGEYSFNTNETEHMTVITGVCLMNGQTVRVGERYIAPAHTTLVLKATEPVVYTCTYHPES